MNLITFLKILLFTGISLPYTAQKMKFSIKDYFSKCDQIRNFLRIWSHLLKKSLMENFIFCAMVFFSKDFWSFSKFFQSISTSHSVPFKFMHTFVPQMKDADFWPNSSWWPCWYTSDCQIMSYSHVEKDVNSNEQLKLNPE